MSQAPFDINQVQVQLVLSAQQAGVVLKGLSKLPFEEVDQLYHGIRTVAAQAIQKAEEAALVQQSASAAPEAEPSAAQ